MAKQKLSDETLFDTNTGEILTPDQLNVVKEVITHRPNGTLRIQQDFSNCPSLAEQHTAHLTDINYLIKKYKPDELAAYIAARAAYRSEILGHDFSLEFNLQDAKNVIYNSRKEFEALPDKIRQSFSSHLEFLKFIDNPANAQKMLDLGILTQKQLSNLKIEETAKPTNSDQSADVGEAKGAKK